MMGHNIFVAVALRLMAAVGEHDESSFLSLKIE